MNLEENQLYLAGEGAKVLGDDVLEIGRGG